MEMFHTPRPDSGISPVGAGYVLEMKAKKTAAKRATTKLMETKLTNETHTPLVQVKPRACDCPTAFFYSQVPCMNEPHNYTGGTTNTFMFNDAVYNKTNSNIYALDTDGALLILTAGTYFATVKLTLSFNGDTTGSFVGSHLVVESPNQTQQQQMPIILQPLMPEHGTFGTNIFTANAVIHVGDPNYGISTPVVRAYLWLSVDGALEYTTNIEFTVRN